MLKHQCNSIQLGMLYIQMYAESNLKNITEKRYTARLPNQECNSKEMQGNGIPTIFAIT